MTLTLEAEDNKQLYFRPDTKKSSWTEAPRNPFIQRLLFQYVTTATEGTVPPQSDSGIAVHSYSPDNGGVAQKRIQPGDTLSIKYLSLSITGS